MKRNRLLAYFLVAGLRLVAAPAEFDHWVDRFTDDWVRLDPELATQSQYFTGAEQDVLDRALTPITDEARGARVALARRGVNELARFKRSELDSTQRISADMLGWQLDAIIRADEFENYTYVFEQFNGLQVGLVKFLTQTHPIRQRRDVENYLARLQLVAARMEEGIVQANRRAELGFIPPDFILRSTLAQFDRFLADEPGKNVLVVSLDERAAKVITLSATERAEFVASAERTVREQIIPAFQRARQLLENQLPRATADAGISRFPGGDRAYANSLHRLTTTNLSAEQIHSLGLKEVARIETVMDGLLRQIGYKEGSIKQRIEKLESDLQPPASPDPRPALLARYEAITRDAEKRAAAMFDLRPKAPVEIRREPVFTEKSAAAHYTAPARDGSRPGIFWAPLPGPQFEIISMRTLVYHEAVPGHHFQVALQKELPGLPRFRGDRLFGSISAHSEGWALYAEQLAAESGWYEGDPQGLLGQLDDELFRARRLVVDTGIHTKGWTRQQAIDYGIKASEVERYVVWPGQACSYKIGMLKILELRAKAQRALGADFSIKNFHNVILGTGTVPLDVLEHVIDDTLTAAIKR
ncbi:MAG: DUF885 domain-containing protein [Opitutus sp.]